MMHVSGEMRGWSLKVGDDYVYKDDRLTSADHPKVREIAARYPDRPGLFPERWLQVPR